MASATDLIGGLNNCLSLHSFVALKRLLKNNGLSKLNSLGYTVCLIH